MLTELIIASILIIWILFIFGSEILRYRKRDKEDRKQRDVLIYHCVRCGHLYGAPGPRDEDGCRLCGKRNESLKF